MPGIRNFKSKAFPNTGIYIIRSKDIYLGITCGTNIPSEEYTHAHNDKLGFELNIDGRDFFVDPGTFTYTGSFDVRNSFRSTAFHNTVTVDDEEQNPFPRDNVFALPDVTQAKALIFEGDDENHTFSGEHYGYQRLSDPVIHQRKFLLDKAKKNIAIEDHLLGKEEHKISYYFHVHPEVDISFLNNEKIILKNREVSLEMVFDLKDFHLYIDNSSYANSLGQKQNNKRIVLEKKTKLPFKSNVTITY